MCFPFEKNKQNKELLFYMNLLQRVRCMQDKRETKFRKLGSGDVLSNYFMMLTSTHWGLSTTANL